MFGDRSTTMIGSLESTTVNVSPRRRSKFRSNYLICHIDVSAFLAIMIALLYLLMTPSFFPDRHQHVSVDLAKVGHPGLMRAADKEDALDIGVLRDGKVFFRTDLVRPEDLPARIHDAVAHGAENKVYIRADAHTKFALVESVLDAVRASGVENVAFITEQRHPSASQ
jgi:biopolymer transport protein ExbD